LHNQNEHVQGFRGQILYFTDNPSVNPDAVHWHSDGILIVKDGLIVEVCDFLSDWKERFPNLEIQHFPEKIIMPGFIDAHTHYPQTEMIASPADGLLPWLEQYTFPTEAKFQDFKHATRVASFFLDQLIDSGTTTAMVFGTVHRSSIDAFFEESSKRQMRMIAGKAIMDRNCPAYLRDTAETAVIDSEALIQQWHGKQRQLYALTPRFAPSCSPQQLHLVGELAEAYQDVYLQSHVAENTTECKWALELFPHARSYLDIYDKFKLLRPKSMYGHGIWLDDEDRARLADTGAAVAHCPTSNLFLGSGLFPLHKTEQAGVHIALATDVGAGSSFSMLHTMNEAYKIARMSGHHLSAHHMFYLATLGAAKSLNLSDKIGSFQAGCEADFIILDKQATPILACKTQNANSLEELLFAFALLGDDRSVYASFVLGKRLK